MRTVTLELKTEWTEKEFEAGRKLAEQLVGDKDMGIAFITHDNLPGFKLIANRPQYTKFEGVVVMAKQFNEPFFISTDSLS
jgi:hypothetical protein